MHQNMASYQLMNRLLGVGANGVLFKLKVEPIHRVEG